MTETLTERTARSVRGRLAEARITGSALARTLGWSIPSTTRRLRGDVPFALDELQQIADVLDVPVSALLPEDVAA